MSRRLAPIAASAKCGAPALVKFDEHSRSAQTDRGAVALYGVALAMLDDDPGVRPDAYAFIIATTAANGRDPLERSPS